MCSEPVLETNKPFTICIPSGPFGDKISPGRLWATSRVLSDVPLGQSDFPLLNEQPVRRYYSRTTTPLATTILES